MLVISQDKLHTYNNNNNNYIGTLYVYRIVEDIVPTIKLHYNNTRDDRTISCAYDIINYNRRLRTQNNNNNNVCRNK